MIKNGKELFKLIKDNENQELMGSDSSKLFSMAHKVTNTGGKEDREKIKQSLIELSEFLPVMTEKDLVSLISFVAILDLQDRQLFKIYENKIDEISNPDIIAFVLRLLSIIDRKSLSRSLITSSEQVNFVYPSFILDLLFDVNPFETIKLFEDKSIELADAFEIFEKWLAFLVNDKAYYDLAKTFLVLMSNKYKNQTLYEEWLSFNKSSINRIHGTGISNYDTLMEVFDKMISNAKQKSIGEYELN